MQKLKVAFPTELQAIHFCSATLSMRLFVAAQKLYMDNFTRFRTLEHSGTHEEINFALQTYGINTDDNPVKPGGIIDTTFYNKWLEAQKQYEEGNSSQATLVPRRFDVLFGKSKRSVQHPGTMRCQLLVEMHWDAYNRLAKAERGQIAEKIVGIVYDSQGRFLKWDAKEKSWVEVDFDTAREKVTHYFRALRERKQKLQKQATVNESKKSDGTKRAVEDDTRDAVATPSLRTHGAIGAGTNVDVASLASKKMRAPERRNSSESIEI